MALDKQNKGMMVYNTMIKQTISSLENTHRTGKPAIIFANIPACKLKCKCKLLMYAIIGFSNVIIIQVNILSYIVVIVIWNINIFNGNSLLYMQVFLDVYNHLQYIKMHHITTIQSMNIFYLMY